MKQNELFICLPASTNSNVFFLRVSFTIKLNFQQVYYERFELRLTDIKEV